MTETTKGPKIVQFLAENTRILKLVRINPTGNAVIIGGENEQGKTTVLDDIELTIASSQRIEMPKVPIRRGASEGKCELHLGDPETGEIMLVVRREWSAGGTRLVVTNPEGGKVPGGPQAIMDKLVNTLAFDPLDFADKMDPKKQAAVLRQLVGIDFSALDAQRADAYTRREDSGRDLKKAEGHLASLPEAPAGTPDVEVVIAELIKEQQAAQSKNLAATEAERIARRAAAEVEEAADRVAEARAELEEAEAALSAATDARAQADMRFEQAKAQRVDMDPITKKLASAESVNRLVRAKAARAQQSTEVERLRKIRADLTAKIEGIDAEKRTTLAKVPWPIDGLGFDDDGTVTMNGLPFSQASKAQRYRVSVAIAARMHPALRVMLLRDASLLDEKSLQLMIDLANEFDLQAWIERVGDKDPGAVVLVDGEVANDGSSPDGWTTPVGKKRAAKKAGA